MLAIKECLIREGTLNSKNNACNKNNDYAGNNKYRKYSCNACNDVTILPTTKQLSKSSSTFQSDLENIKNSEDNLKIAASSSALLTANVNCQQKQQQPPPQQQHQQQQIPNQETATAKATATTAAKFLSNKQHYQGHHPHYHHHTPIPIPSYCTDLYLKIHKLDQNNSLNENYQSVYRTITNLVRNERQFSPYNINTNINSIKENLQREAQQPFNIYHKTKEVVTSVQTTSIRTVTTAAATTTSKAEFFCGGVGDALQLKHPHKNCNTWTSELNKASDFSKYNLKQGLHGRNRQCFPQQKQKRARSFRVHSESRPISALYEIIFKEKDSNNDSSSGNNSNCSNTTTNDEQEYFVQVEKEQSYRTKYFQESKDYKQKLRQNLRRHRHWYQQRSLGHISGHTSLLLRHSTPLTFSFVMDQNYFLTNTNEMSHKSKSAEIKHKYISDDDYGATSTTDDSVSPQEDDYFRRNRNLHFHDNNNTIFNISNVEVGGNRIENRTNRTNTRESPISPTLIFKHHHELCHENNRSTLSNSTYLQSLDLSQKGAPVAKVNNADDSKHSASSINAKACCHNCNVDDGGRNTHKNKYMSNLSRSSSFDTKCKANCKSPPSSSTAAMPLLHKSDNVHDESIKLSTVIGANSAKITNTPPKGITVHSPILMSTAKFERPIRNLRRHRNDKQRRHTDGAIKLSNYNDAINNKEPSVSLDLYQKQDCTACSPAGIAHSSHNIPTNATYATAYCEANRDKNCNPNYYGRNHEFETIVTSTAPLNATPAIATRTTARITSKAEDIAVKHTLDDATVTIPLCMSPSEATQHIFKHEANNQSIERHKRSTVRNQTLIPVIGGEVIQQVLLGKWEQRNRNMIKPPLNVTTNAANISTATSTKTNSTITSKCSTVFTNGLHTVESPPSSPTTTKLKQDPLQCDEGDSRPAAVSPDINAPLPTTPSSHSVASSPQMSPNHSASFVIKVNLMKKEEMKNSSSIQKSTIQEPQQNFNVMVNTMAMKNNVNFMETSSGQPLQGVQEQQKEQPQSGPNKGINEAKNDYIRVLPKNIINSDHHGRPPSDRLVRNGIDRQHCIDVPIVRIPSPVRYRLGQSDKFCKTNSFKSKENYTIGNNLNNSNKKNSRDNTDNDAGSEIKSLHLNDDTKPLCSAMHNYEKLKQETHSPKLYELFDLNSVQKSTKITLQSVGEDNKERDKSSKRKSQLNCCSTEETSSPKNSGNNEGLNSAALRRRRRRHDLNIASLQRDIEKRSKNGTVALHTKHSNNDDNSNRHSLTHHVEVAKRDGDSSQLDENKRNCPKTPSRAKHRSDLSSSRVQQQQQQELQSVNKLNCDSGKITQANHCSKGDLNNLQNHKKVSDDSNNKRNYKNELMAHNVNNPTKRKSSPIKCATFLGKECICYEPQRSSVSAVGERKNNEEPLERNHTGILRKQRLLKAHSIEGESSSAEAAPAISSAACANDDEVPLKLSPILRRKSSNDFALSMATACSPIVSILKKKDHLYGSNSAGGVTGESSSTSSNASPVTFSSNVIDTPSCHKRAGILKKRSSLDESHYHSRSHSPEERNILIKTVRRNSLEETAGAAAVSSVSIANSVMGAHQHQHHGILKQSSYDSNKSDGCPSISGESHVQPQSILKKKDSNSTPSDSGAGCGGGLGGNSPHFSKHVSISQAVILAAAELYGNKNDFACQNDSSSYISCTPTNEEYELRPILKIDTSSSEEANRPPKPILKKNSRGDSSDDYEIKPILKTSRKSSREEFDLINFNKGMGDEQQQLQSAESSVKPILKIDSPLKKRSIVGDTFDDHIDRDNEFYKQNSSASSLLTLKHRARSLERVFAHKHIITGGSEGGSGPIIDLAEALNAIATSQTSTNELATTLTNVNAGQKPNQAASLSVSERIKFMENHISKKSANYSITYTVDKTNACNGSAPEMNKADSGCNINILQRSQQLCTPRTSNKERFKSQPITSEEKNSVKCKDLAVRTASFTTCSAFKPANVFSALQKAESTPITTLKSCAGGDTNSKIPSPSFSHHSYTQTTATTTTLKEKQQQQQQQQQQVSSKKFHILKQTHNNHYSMKSTFKPITTDHSELNTLSTSKKMSDFVTGECSSYDREVQMEELNEMNSTKDSKESVGQCSSVVRTNSVRARAHMFQQLQANKSATSSFKGEERTTPKKAASIISDNYDFKTPPSSEQSYKGFVPLATLKTSETDATTDSVETQNSDDEIEPSSLPLSERLRFFSNLSSGSSGGSTLIKQQQQQQQQQYSIKHINKIATTVNTTPTTSRYNSLERNCSFNASYSGNVTPCTSRPLKTNSPNDNCNVDNNSTPNLLYNIISKNNDNSANVNCAAAANTIQMSLNEIETIVKRVERKVHKQISIHSKMSGRFLNHLEHNCDNNDNGNCDAIDNKDNDIVIGNNEHFAIRSNNSPFIHVTPSTLAPDITTPTIKRIVLNMPHYFLDLHTNDTNNRKLEEDGKHYEEDNFTDSGKENIEMNSKRSRPVVVEMRRKFSNKKVGTISHQIQSMIVNSSGSSNNDNCCGDNGSGKDDHSSGRTIDSQCNSIMINGYTSQPLTVSNKSINYFHQNCNNDSSMNLINSQSPSSHIKESLQPLHYDDHKNCDKSNVKSITLKMSHFLNNDANNNSKNHHSLENDGINHVNLKNCLTNIETTTKKIGKIKSPFIENCNNNKHIEKVGEAGFESTVCQAISINKSKWTKLDRKVSLPQNNDNLEQFIKQQNCIDSFHSHNGSLQTLLQPQLSLLLQHQLPSTSIPTNPASINTMQTKYDVNHNNLIRKEKNTISKLEDNNCKQPIVEMRKKLSRNLAIHTQSMFISSNYNDNDISSSSISAQSPYNSSVVTTTATATATPHRPLSQQFNHASRNSLPLYQEYQQIIDKKLQKFFGINNNNYPITNVNTFSATSNSTTIPFTAYEQMECFEDIPLTPEDFKSVDINAATNYDHSAPLNYNKLKCFDDIIITPEELKNAEQDFDKLFLIF